ncbi:MAG TPA: hypothetical protein VGN86_12465 [Pyrinomonadaceae bacterium]|jgi:hypothetical protein|nr:hypothetical protein [Pyrinomonadaceae bacterium]
MSRLDTAAPPILRAVVELEIAPEATPPASLELFTSDCRGEVESSEEQARRNNIFATTVTLENSTRTGLT